MANRGFNRKQALEKEVKELFVLLTFGSSGAVTMTKGVGIASVSKTSTGLYKITLQDKYVSLKSVSGTFESTSAEDIRVQVKDETVSTTKIINIFTLTGASETSPASGTKLYVKIEVKNTSVE